MLRIILPFLMGVVLSAFAIEWIYWKETSVFIIAISFIAALLAAILVMALHRKPHQFGWGMWLVMFVLGAGLTLSRSSEVYSDHIGSIDSTGIPQPYFIKVVDEPQVKENSVKVVAELSDVGVREFGKVLLYFERDSASENIKYGQEFLISSTLQLVENLGNPNEFNYKRYLRFNGISHRGYVRSDAFKWLSDGNPGLWGWMYDLRASLIQKFKEGGLEGEELSVASALVLGFRADLDRELMSAYAGAGATHVLAVSGLHVGIVYVILNTLLKFLDRRKYGRIIKTILLISALFGYAALTGLSASVFRAATMFAFVAVGKAISRDTNIFNTLGASAFVLVAFDPMIIMQVGFQLSYLAVIGIVLIQPRLFKLYVFENRFKDWAWSITCVSIAAQIATFPLGLLYFHQFPNLFLISNLLVIPAAAAILYLGFSLFLFSFWKPTLLFFGTLLKLLISALNSVVVWIERIPYSVLSGIDITIMETLIIYAVIGGLLVFVIHQSAKAFYVSGVLAVVFVAMQCVEVYAQKNQQLITVYNVKGHTAIALVDGVKVTFISDEEFYSNEQSMLFHIRHHWWRLGVEEEVFVALSDSLVNKSLGWDNQRFSILDLKPPKGQSVQILEPSQFDFAIIDKVGWKPIDGIGNLDAGNFIVTNGTDLRARELFKDDLNENLSFVSESGAIIWLAQY